MAIRTRIKSNGDLIIEQTTLEHGGEFRVETVRDKLFFPLKIDGSNFDPTTVQELYFVDNLAQVSGTTLLVSFSGSLVSGTIAADVLTLSSSILSLSSSISSSFAQLRHDELNNLLADDHTQYLHVSGTHPMVGNLNMNGYSVASASYVDLIPHTLGEVPANEGRTYYDSDDHTFAYWGRSDTVPIKPGQEHVVYCVNKTTGTIWRGAAVYVSGALGSQVKIGLADANGTPEAVVLMGLSLESIPVNESGYCIFGGVAQNINTSPWPENTLLYLSERAGELTSTPPTGSNAIVLCGIVVTQHATQGIMGVRIHNAGRLEYMSDIFDGNPITTGSHLISSGGYWTRSDFATDVKDAAANGLWQDLQGQLDSSTGASTNLTLDTFDNSGFQRLFFQHNQDSYCSLSYQMPHGWNNSIVRPHLHLMPCAEPGLNTTGSVAIGYQYAWCHGTNRLTSWTTGSTSLLISASMYLTNQKLLLGQVSPGVGAGPSSILLMRIMRSGTSGIDTYDTNKPISSGSTQAANLALLYPDVHYQYTRLGTINELSD